MRLSRGEQPPRRCQVAPGTHWGQTARSPRRPQRAQSRFYKTACCPHPQLKLMVRILLASRGPASPHRGSSNVQSQQRLISAHEGRTHAPDALCRQRPEQTRRCAHGGEGARPAGRARSSGGEHPQALAEPLQQAWAELQVVPLRPPAPRPPCLPPGVELEGKTGRTRSVETRNTLCGRLCQTSGRPPRL